MSERTIDTAAGAGTPVPSVSGVRAVSERSERIVSAAAFAVVPESSVSEAQA
ncbi:hypothetical protein OHB12_30650 [Nocardia sp. NBC_01730]|uniref:hypothetical protein n=1 Tax=Nocardia sp. NBC_01730 TaxID=2975998 RepID=UPI002E15B062|nr:hypothetical protein OHB12_30650 [Nocardia sp. NBC_01730]